MIAVRLGSIKVQLPVTVDKVEVRANLYDKARVSVRPAGRVPLRKIQRNPHEQVGCLCS